MASASEMMQRTQLLLNDTNFEVFNEEDILRYVNMARGQIAGQAECVRIYTTLPVTGAAQQYPFSAIVVPANVGVQGYLHVRQISYAVASGQKLLHSRSFPWFNSFILGQPVPKAGPPSAWSQFGQGVLGSIFFNLLDQAYTLSLDCVAYPIDLVDDSTVDAIPYSWTDAVPFFAAYFAALTIGDSDRAKALYGEYEKFSGLGRNAATPSVLPGSFAQAPDPFMANRLGLQTRGQQ